MRETQSVIRPSAGPVHAIVNPAAGNGASGRAWPRVAAQLATAGFPAVAHLTTARGDATWIARDIAAKASESEYTTIIAVGGDGTINEVVNGIVQSLGVDAHGLNDGPRVRLATIPSGTGKDFARAVQTRTPEATIAALREGDTVRIDLGRAASLDATTGRVDERYFAVFADCGLGAQAAERINRSTKALGAYATYAIGAVRAVAAFKPWEVHVEVDGVPLYGGRSAMIVCANTRTFAGGMLVAPQASLCDGQLDVFIVKDVNRRTLLTSLLPRVYRGKHVGHEDVIWVRGREVLVQSGESIGVGVDGEVAGGAPLDVSIVPSALEVLCARGALAGDVASGRPRV